MTQRTTKVTKTPQNPQVKKALDILFVCVAVALTYKIGTTLYNKKVTADQTKKATACPTLLSISRSARDTLLVMKSEPLCNQFVLDTIQ